MSERVTRIVSSAQEILAARIAEAERGHQRGWVFTPLNGKRPMLRGWPSREEPTLEQVREWARVGNLGLRTGATSGVFVIDEDLPKGGDATFLDLPPTPTVETGGGGRHRYFRMPSVSLGNSASKLGPSIDTRGDGGQVAFVGSVHPMTGKVYRWVPGLSPDEIALADLPERVLRKLRIFQPGDRLHPTRPIAIGSGYGAWALRNEAERVRAAAKGARNNTLNIVAFNLARFIPIGLLDEQAIREALLNAAIESGLSEREALTTIRSGVRAGKEIGR